jgi:hypothetical protein
MRKWLVKNFVLDYQHKMFGKTWNAPRASRIIFPLFVITGFLNARNLDWPEPTLLIWVMYLLCAVALYFGFVHFKIFPVKWEELDDFQKFQYGMLKGGELTSEQYIEWVKLSKKYLDF